MQSFIQMSSIPRGTAHSAKLVSALCKHVALAGAAPVSYTHMTAPTVLSVEIPVASVDVIAKTQIARR